MYPVRVNIGIMCFVGCLIAYMLRVNLSITILAMTVPRNSTDGNNTISNVPDVRHIVHITTNLNKNFFVLIVVWLVWASLRMDVVSRKFIIGSVFLGLSYYFSAEWFVNYKELNSKYRRCLKWLECSKDYRNSELAIDACAFKNYSVRTALVDCNTYTYILFRSIKTTFRNSSRCVEDQKLIHSLLIL